jgi:hypothetical protein
VRNGSLVLDHRDVKARDLQRADSGFTALAGSLNEDLDSLESVLHGSLGGCFRSGLRSEGSIFLGTAETEAACTGPGNGISVGVRDSYYSIIETGADVSLAVFNILAFFFLTSDSSFLSGCSHDSNLPLFLFAGDRLAGAFSGPGIGLGTLSANGQTGSVTLASVAVDLYQTLDVERGRSAHVAFYNVFFVNDISEFADVIFGQIFNSDIGIYSGLVEDLFRLGTADAVYIGQSDLDALISG